ncbi:lysophospholipid acyltransferase LPEAT1 isoform X2 [Populus alba]|uniref:Phospholipid/glycerol acyltransferase family protein n=1 Tax=Populus alba TaxID=43335 RepID=A0A4U5QXS3_POPAL|nr:lysophospholipid acyltransferase LPEAT1 isoform X2 [Populus alba]TKS15958.1 phospholipid/glycerol acyltransferase family protein [Populus alba]
MDTELKSMNPDPPKPEQPDPASRDDGSNSKDDRPLLKSDSNRISSTTGESIEELEKKFAAYVRNDVYGPMGRGELPLVEKVLLGIAVVTLVPIRFVLALIILVVYYIICRVCTLFSAPNRDEEEEQEDFAHMGGWRRAVIVWCGRFLSRMLLFVLGFYWISVSYRDIELPDQNKSSSQNEGKDQSEEPERLGAIISNHVSYLDILYHMSASFPSFVAKRSVAKLPLVGLISKCLGCVYVQRELKSSDFKGVSGIVTERVKESHENSSAPMMMLFPEGTTTNGDFLLPFKTGAFLATAPVRPVILRYPYQRFSPAWDSISGALHVFYLFCQFINHMEAVWLPVYYPSQEEKDDPKLYASNVRRLMAREGNLTMSDIGLAEKRIYHTALNGLF